MPKYRVLVTKDAACLPTARSHQRNYPVLSVSPTRRPASMFVSTWTAGPIRALNKTASTRSE
ncbi:hypothetical protein ABIF63_002155 [Bradyrhizobium japonicum]|uniref:Uncharacterized protein n=1 Tax=Bradyrhizobium japonicum TaxID=375 RepID=A0ABV2RM82_BRAJP|nr:hypothetical protein [Bradyrhizobium japonicum]MCP1806777.1 hypothetical protein [Bradyrhizobium japonicum]MCP1815702.1 hypothetical protein [Bradyrhizobium japonicum]